MRIAGLVLVALLAIVGTVATLAPAQWAAAAVRNVTEGRVDLAETTGSLWRGQATVVLSSGVEPGASRASLPERLSWWLSPWPLLIGTIDLTLSHPSALAQPLTVRVAPGSPTVIGATTLRLPASLLVGLGAPFNTLRPGGVLTINWDRLQIEPGRVQGGISADWQFASSVLTPVSPFGHYRMTADGGYPATRLQLTTISGPLELAGNGTIAEGGRLRFEGSARPVPGTDPAVKSQLTGLISLLGPRRDSETVTLRFGS
ncbi:MAG: type II secretion system protein N [Burkholderiales bacterium]|jgi:general secretion pathway protein N|nr:type II secretion system protein N [Burkholderiales bacterium]